MKPLTPKQRDAFLDSAAMTAIETLYGSKLFPVDYFDMYAERAYTFAHALLAERDRRTQETK